MEALVCGKDYNIRLFVDEVSCGRIDVRREPFVTEDLEKRQNPSALIENLTQSLSL